MSDTPPNQVTQVLSQLQALWERQSAGRRRLAILIVLAIAGGVVWTQLLHRPSPWTVMSEAASPDDTEELASVLRARGVPVRVNGGKIEVPENQVDTARAAAAAAGLPHSGKGFELFDGSSFGKSSFTEQINYRRALEGELARSIATLAQVEGARVHLALGRRSVFKDREELPSASIALRLHPGQTLTGEQVRGIHQLVASSVDGLKPDAVSIVDNHGNLLDAGDPSAGNRKAEIERTVSGRVRGMLERVVGAGHVTVVATADVDDRQVSETQEVFDHEHPVVRSESRTLDGVDPAQTVGGVAGTRGNLPGAPAATPGAAPGAGATGRMQETKNYEVSRTVRQTTKPEIEVKRLHVAIVVDYKTDGAGKVMPRTDTELAELGALARQAAAIDDSRGDKIELRAMPFAPDDTSGTDVAPAKVAGLPIMYIAAGAGGALVFLVLVVFVALRRRRRRETPASAGPHLALPVPIAELERALARTAPHALAAAQGDPAHPALPEGRTVRDRVLEVARVDIERTAGVLSGWLANAAAAAPAPHAHAPAAGKPAAPAKAGHS